MKENLKRLKLVDSMTTTLQISKGEFINRLHEITEEGSTSMMSDTFDIFSSSKKEFKGQVNYESFKIKRRARFFEVNRNLAVANGTFSESNGQLQIDTEIKGFDNFIIVFSVFLFLFYCAFIFGFMASANTGGLIAISFILFHGAVMFGALYFMLRRSVKRLKYELEREFFYLTRTK